MKTMLIPVYFKKLVLAIDVSVSYIFKINGTKI